MVNQLRRMGISPEETIFPSPLGPINLHHLPFLEGWKYNLYMVGYPGTEPVLVNGGPATILADFTDERGWVISCFYIARSPYCTMNFTVDNWVFNLNPFLMHTIGPVLANNATFYEVAYNPVTPLGPMYGLMFNPSYPMPYSSRLQINLNLPAGSPVAATTVFGAMIGKIHIQDYSLFLRSVKRFTAEQMSGVKIERYP